MSRRALALAVCTAIAAVSCRDSVVVPAAPTFARQGDPLACDINEAQRAAGSYFSGEARKQARTIITLIGNAPRTAAARGYGFDVMAMVAQAVAGGTGGSPASGSELTNELILCMFNPAGGPLEFPAVFPVDFVPSLDPVVNGGYAVVGPTADATPVLARGALPPSGIAPPPGFTWGSILTERILIYGHPISAGAYDWSTIRPGADFVGPGALVGLCINAGNLMVHEEHVGLLVYQDAYFLPLACETGAFAPEGRGLFASLGRLATAVLLPKPAHAAVLLNPGGVGGLAGGLRSIFSSEEIEVVNAIFLTQPLDASAGAPIPTSPDGGIVVRALTGGLTVPGATLSLGSSDNNGQPAALSCPSLPGGVCTAVTNGAGEASFGHPVQVKTGGYRLVVTGGVTGRTIVVTAGESDRFNVRP